jgi:pimeloyl-ACP methyl ester carboxylesterase
MADYARDAHAFLDHLNWDTCGVLGISFGGMVAQEFATTWPERVHRLVLACTSSGGPGGRSYPLHELFDLDEEERVRRMIPLSDSRFTDEWLAERPQDRAYFTRSAVTPTTESVTEGARGSEGVTTARQGAWWQLMARRDHDVWDRLPRIQCPTLVMSGRYDGIAPPENGAAIKSQVSGSEQRIYDGGHQFFIQDRRALPEMSLFLSEPSTTRNTGEL